MRINKIPLEMGNYLSQESQEIWQKAIEKVKDELLLKMQTKQFQLLLGRKERKKMPTYMKYKLKYGDMVVVEYLNLHLNIVYKYCYNYWNMICYRYLHKNMN